MKKRDGPFVFLKCPSISEDKSGLRDFCNVPTIALFLILKHKVKVIMNINICRLGGHRRGEFLHQFRKREQDLMPKIPPSLKE